MGLKEHLFTGCLILLNSFCFCSNYIEDTPRNVSIQYSADGGNLWEGDGNITIRCNAECNPPCGIYQIYHNNKLKITTTSEETTITKDRKNSGQYFCSVSNSGGQGYVQSNDIAIISIKYPPGKVIIVPEKEIFYTKKNGKPYVDVVCKADCSPPCTYSWYFDYHHTPTLFTTGNTLFATKTFQDYNNFYCNASNSLGSSNSTWVTVIVKDGPENVTITPSQTPNENSKFSLVCSANCLHGCTSYRWSHGGKPLDGRKAILTFNNLSKADHGEYKCSVEDYFGIKSISYTLSVQSANDLGSSYSKWTTVKVRDGPRNVRIEYAADDGDFWEGAGYITITCNADCNPPCDRYQIYHNYKLKKTSTSKDTMITKTRENSGLYYCTASNSLRLEYVRSSYTVSITIKYQMIILESHLQNVSLRVNGDLPSSVTCRVECNFSDCHSDINVTKDSQHIRTISSSQSIFEKRKAGISDSGTYNCNLGNRKSIRNFTLNILYGPRQTRVTKNNGFMDFENIEEKKDETIPLFCSSTCYPPCGIYWYKDGTLLSGETTESFDMPRNRTMTGNYTCKANGVEGSQISDPVKVLVTFPPESVRIIPDMDIFYSKRDGKPYVDVVCKADCVPPCAYMWYSAYYRSLWNRGSFFTHGDMLFATRKFTYNRDRYFYCIVSNNLGSSYSKWITVSVKDSPTNVTVHYLSTYGHLIEKQDYITISCNADCNPACYYQFYRNGQLVNAVYGQLSSRAYRNMSGRYTCSAKTSLANIYKSSNFVDIYIKYKPSIALNLSANRTQITAPGSLDLIFSIDSFPPSNVTVYHIKDKLRTFQNMTGLHLFATPIMSCLDEGEYRVEAVNDVGSNSDSVSVDVLCSPIIINFVNVSDRGFKIGERLELTVAFKGNPKPEASWIFNPWKSNVSHSVQIQRIRNQPPDRTTVVIQTLNAIDFGIYKLRLKNNYGNISKDFKIQGPPTEPTDLYVECPGPAIVFWKPGFDGGSEQTFIIEYTSNQSFWQIHRQTSAAVFTDDYLKSFVDNISPNILYFFRIKAKNSFGEAISESEVNCTQQRQPATSNEPSIESSTMLNKTAISEDTVLSPTSRKRKTINMREMEMKNLVLEHTKLGEEIQKLRAERKVLELKQQYYTARLKQILKDHSG